MRTKRTRRDLTDYIAELEQRIRALETSRRLGSASVDGGELTITGGDVVVRTDSGEVITVLRHGGAPRIDMYPVSEANDDYALRVLGWESSSQGAAYQVDVNRIDGSGSAIRDGGKLLLMKNAAYLSHQPESGNEAYVQMGPSELVYIQGKWNRDGGGTDAVVVGFNNVAVGFGSFGYTYSSPADSGTLVPVVQMVNTGGALAGCLIAMSNSGWTYSWASGTAAKTINYACFRVM